MTPAISAVLLVSAVLAVLFIAEVWRELHSFKVTRYTIKLGRLPESVDGLRIVFLSDLHNREYGRENERLYQAVRAEQPDLILIGGDMLVGKDGVSYEPARRFVRKLPEICPVYYANGNHEQRMKEEPENYSDSYTEYKAVLEQSGVRFLENESKVLSVRNMCVELCALELPLDTYRKLKKAQVTPDEVAELTGRAVRKPEQKSDLPYRILLAHNPAYMDAYKAWGADLILSGHLHGGIVRVPFLGGVISPQAFLFPKYSGELTIEGEQAVIVSRGLGTHTIHLRLFNTPELVSVFLKPQAAEDKNTEK